MLEEGQQAPAFTGTDQNGDPVKLEEFRGQTVVLYFYPEDATPGCTKEACSFRDRYDDLQNENVTVIGVSADTVESHADFAKKQRLSFTLIADPEHEIIDMYDVRGSFGNAQRVTYLIDDTGTIQHVYTDIDTEQHADTILNDLQK